MSLKYVKGSMKKLDEDNDGIPDTLMFKVINYIGTGSSYITVKTCSSFFTYGDEVTIKINYHLLYRLAKAVT